MPLDSHEVSANLSFVSMQGFLEGAAGLIFISHESFDYFLFIARPLRNQCRIETCHFAIISDTLVQRAQGIHGGEYALIVCRVYSALRISDASNIQCVRISRVSKSLFSSGSDTMLVK